MDLLAPLLQRPVIIALAIVGGVISVLGSVLLRRGSWLGPQASRFVLRTGYAITWSSVALFIAAGFWGSE